jgi:nucleoid DNA-binding protein
MSTTQKHMTKTEIISALAETSDLDKQQVAKVLDELANLIGKNLGDDGPGVFTIPGLMKLTVAHKPATEEREGINPFTKEPMIIKAKPASKAVKVRPLKSLKDMV